MTTALCFIVEEKHFGTTLQVSSFKFQVYSSFKFIKKKLRKNTKQDVPLLAVS